MLVPVLELRSFFYLPLLKGHATGDEFTDDPMTDMLINHVATNPVCPTAALEKKFEPK
jgi:hypothetical protein